MKYTIFKGEAVPFVMELPNYRMPGAKNVLRLLWDKAKDFFTRAFTVIFFATIIVWFLQSFDTHFNMITNSESSIMAKAAGLLVPVFVPLGLGDWRVVTSFISGFIAKESVVATMEMLFEGGVRNTLTTGMAGTILVFSLLYTPCVAAIASIKRELGAKNAVLVVIWQCFVAWLVALLFRYIFMALGM